MVDLYWQFSAWCAKPLVLTNWVALLGFVLICGLLSSIQKTLHAMHVLTTQLANIVAAKHDSDR